MSAEFVLDPSPPRKPLQRQEQDLCGRTALVTGATKGIGRAIVLELAARGCHILGTYSSPSSAQLFEALANTVHSIYNDHDAPVNPKIIGRAADITAPDSATTVILDALDKHFYGEVDIIVFNAAVMGLAKMGEGSVNQKFVESSLAGNVQFPILLMEKLVSGDYIRENGRVIAISSEGVRASRPGGGSVYAASKAALECLMRQWADELGIRPGMQGTTFNSISVGFTKTEAYNRIPSPMREQLTASDAAEVAVGNRIGEVEDVADVVGLLVSEKARWISGSVVDGSGGKAKIM